MTGIFSNTLVAGEFGYCYQDDVDREYEPVEVETNVDKVEGSIDREKFNFQKFDTDNCDIPRSELVRSDLESSSDIESSDTQSSDIQNSDTLNSNTQNCDTLKSDTFDSDIQNCDSLNPETPNSDSQKFGTPNPETLISETLNSETLKSDTKIFTQTSSTHISLDNSHSIDAQNPSSDNLVNILPSTRTNTAGVENTYPLIAYSTPLSLSDGSHDQDYSTQELDSQSTHSNSNSILTENISQSEPMFLTIDLEMFSDLDLTMDGALDYSPRRPRYTTGMYKDKTLITFFLFQVLFIQTSFSEIFWIMMQF